MNPLSGFFEKFSKLLVGSKIIKDAVRSTIASQTSLKLLESEVEYKNGTILIKAHPVAKSAIFMRKKSILDELKKNLGDKAPRDIR